MAPSNKMTADGTLYLTVTLDHALSGDHFHYVQQVGFNRWNHDVLVRTSKQVASGWFGKLLKAGYAFAAGTPPKLSS